MKKRYKSGKSSLLVVACMGICAAITKTARESTGSIDSKSRCSRNSSSEIRVWVCGATKHGVKSIRTQRQGSWVNYF